MEVISDEPQPFGAGDDAAHVGQKVIGDDGAAVGLTPARPEGGVPGEEGAGRLIAGAAGDARGSFRGEDVGPQTSAPALADGREPLAAARRQRGLGQPQAKVHPKGSVMRELQIAAAHHGAVGDDGEGHWPYGAERVAGEATHVERLGEHAAEAVLSLLAPPDYLFAEDHEAAGGEPDGLHVHVSEDAIEVAQPRRATSPRIEAVRTGMTAAAIRACGQLSPVNAP